MTRASFREASRGRSTGVSVYSVEQVNRYIRNMFDQDFLLCRVSVRGEVSNCKDHPSGHLYFTLKDESGTLSAVMFAGDRKGLSFPLKEGQKVVVSGKIGIYEAAGRYQLYAKGIRLDGVGELYARFEALKQSLEEMGMFAEEYKKAIPSYVKKLGVVTAASGAAIRDILNIAKRRNPYVQIYLYSAQVQGEGAVASLVKGIETLDAMGLDCLIVGRGGGSLEELWAFNEEAVARAVFDCDTPVISAVGHETDTTITDYVADFRAPTPSAAAELAVFDYRILEQGIYEKRERLSRLMQYQLERKKSRADLAASRLRSFAPGSRIKEFRIALSGREERLRGQMEDRLKSRRHALAILAQKLEGFSPLHRFRGGYAYTETEEGRPVSGIADLKDGERIRIHYSDGYAKARIERIFEGQRYDGE
ncbi:MAG: exodeoxyribonuclease VII large subunit [Lachnospiraceae bacterium]|nr:exodeoxyribonuclease VII large subunit [Lachnospiraceae bacterium]